VARLGSRRVAVLLPGSGLEACQAAAERLRARAHELLHTTLEGAAAGSLHISVGVDALPGTAAGAATLTERAEQALARARRGGGNAVALFSNAAPAAADNASHEGQQP
jgi:two-component system cell cycle response regulator